jgi:ubiquinone/menaquinone biosynthesis C-methylase UbiE
MNSKIELTDLFKGTFPEISGVLIASGDSTRENQYQTNEIFSDKWVKYNKEDQEKQEQLFEFQKKWYLDLYDFSSEDDLKSYLQQQEVVLDAGCGLGYKAKWFAELSPKTFVIGMDYSDAAFVAAKNYSDIANLAFVKGDIADTKIKDGAVSYVSCDQVIHHTENPQETMIELTRILQPEKELAVYVYAKKALPRELLDDYFRVETKNISSKAMWEMSEQLTELGKRLSELNVSIDVPDIPLLGIKEGKIDIQRFIYWNFLKCFWNKELGEETSISTNYDWYAPSNAKRYSQEEFIKMLEKAGLLVKPFHTEEACHSGRFLKGG